MLKKEMMRKKNLVLAGLGTVFALCVIAPKANLQAALVSPRFVEQEQVQELDLPDQVAQLPIPDRLLEVATSMVLNKFQSAFCEDLSQLQSTIGNRLSPPKPPANIQEQAIAFLKENPEMREKFIEEVAPVIANKMFDCGFIP